MNALETSLTLWAICSIVLFEILCIICLFRCYFNRIKPKKFYLKREEYEYLKDVNSSTPAKFQSTILRPPHADELALVGTIRELNHNLTYNNGIQNYGFHITDDDQTIPQVSSSSSTSQHWIDLQSPVINSAQLSPADYEIHTYPINNYPYTHSSLPRPTLIDFQKYHEDYIDNNDNQIESYQFQPLRRPDIILPIVQRIDTATESEPINYSNVVPKSILKSTTNIIPPTDFRSIPYLQTQHSHTPTDYDESPRNSIQITTPQAITINYRINTIEKKISTEPVSSSNLPSSSSAQYRMRFANVQQLNDIQWEVPKEFQTVVNGNQKLYSNRDERTPASIVDSKISIAQQRETNPHQIHYLSKDDIIQQQAFEY